MMTATNTIGTDAIITPAKTTGATMIGSSDMVAGAAARMRAFQDYVHMY